MRLKVNYLKWSRKMRIITMGIVWAFVGVIAFFCSITGHRVVNWAQETIHIATEKAGYHLAQIEVVWQTPSHYTKTDEILKTIGVAQGESMSVVNLKEIQQKIEALPWVRNVAVERYLPSNIKITIEEKTPLALWQNNRKYHPLDEEGQVINTTKQLPADLLLVVGPDAPQNLIPLIQDLEQVPEIYQYVRAAVRVGERRWNLRLFNAEKGLEVLLPETNILGALQRLDSHNKKEKLIKRQVAAIDLRTNDKVILKPFPAPQEKPKAIKK